MNASEFLKKLPTTVNAEAVDGMQSTIQFSISSPVYLVIKDGQCTAHDGVADAPDVILTLTDSNLIALMTGKINGVMAYMSGKLQVDGDLMLAKDLPNLFDTTQLA